LATRVHVDSFISAETETVLSSIYSMLFQLLRHFNLINARVTDAGA